MLKAVAVAAVLPMNAEFVAGRTLRAPALKAAAKATVAACAPPLPARVSHSAASQPAVWVNAVEQQQAVPQAEKPGRTTLADSICIRVAICSSTSAQLWPEPVDGTLWSKL